ncbi:beta-ketoacyl synthase N-terminal-like domain-containing protein [Noviherbaspirillum agri]
MKRTVYIEDGGACCAAGERIEAIWRHLASGTRVLSDLPCPAFAGWPWPRVFTMEEPSAAELDVDRKLLRTMEKQAKLALRGAGLALRDSALFGVYEKSRIGLYLGTPTVDEPVPTWSSLEALHEGGQEASLSEVFLRETPPFTGLSQLNSSACAHIAGTFGMTGAMGAYSPFADAGLQAVIEAALSITSGENDVALAGGVSPKINPMLVLQYDHFGWTADEERIPGEGAAFILLDGSGRGKRRIRLSGYARGFSTGGQGQRGVLQRAFDMAGISAGDLGWILTCDGGDHGVLQSLYGGASLPLGGCQDATGALGPAQPILNLLLAQHGMRENKRLLRGQSGSPHSEQDACINHALITAVGPEGQYVAVILSTERT